MERASPCQLAGDRNSGPVAWDSKKWFNDLARRDEQGRHERSTSDGGLIDEHPEEQPARAGSGHDKECAREVRFSGFRSESIKEPRRG